ncbi:MAG: TrkH family potassium uptake protein [Dehalococcoidia bacterium]
MTRYITPLNLQAVLVHLRLVLRLLGLLLIPSIVVALSFREYWQAVIFAGLSAATLAQGFLGVPSPRPDLELKEALVVTALAYLLFSLLGGLLFLTEAPYIDGVFESMSGFTTTGLSTLEVTQLPISLLFFRASAQWVGGAGIIVITLVVLSGPGRASFQLYGAEFGQPNLVGSVIATARIVMITYAALTALGYLVFLAVGMGPFDSLLHILSSVSTGGLSPHRDSIGHYPQPQVQAAVVVFMILGAIAFPLYYLARRQGPKRLLEDLQLRYLLFIIVAGSVVFFVTLGPHLGHLLPAIFQATSAITGTGFSTVDIVDWSEGSQSLAILMMLVGGSAGSTAGGIKLLRLIILLHLAGWLLARAMLPQEARLPPLRYGSHTISNTELKEIIGFLLLFLLVFTLAGLALTLSGASALSALFESASALGTVVLSSGITHAGAALWIKILLIFEMWVGRLELLPAVVLLYPRTWSLRRRTQ